MSDVEEVAYSERRIKQLIDAEQSRGGMRAGLPKVAVPLDLLMNLHKLAEVRREELAEARAEVERLLKHVCGLSGYNPMIDPPCPGCEQRDRRAPVVDEGLVERIAEWKSENPGWETDSFYWSADEDQQLLRDLLNALQQT